MDTRIPRTDLAWTRIEDALREVGVLLIALTPLDVAFSDAPAPVGTAMFFLSIGLLLFVLSLFIETRRVKRA